MSLSSLHDRVVLLCGVLTALFAAPPWVQAQPEPPRLLVVVTIEQLRSDALERYASDFSSSGFRLLQQGAAVFPRCRYDVGVTLAAPSAATLVSGAPPSQHGIVADVWLDRATNRLARSSIVRGAPSPSRLVGSTLADELNLATQGRARVLAVSGSAAPAVLLAGRSPRGVYWRGESGDFETSAYYGGATPDWLTRFNAARPGKLDASGEVIQGPTVWRALGADDSRPPLRSLEGDHARQLFESSPFAVDELFSLAREAVAGESLGRSGEPDLLFINLTAPAKLALETGAQSPLMRDLFARLDRALARFLLELDETLGLEQVAVALVGLHGSPPQRDDLKLAGIEGGSISGEEVALAMHQALAGEFGSEVGVARYVYPFVYLNEGARRATPERLQRMIDAAGRAAMRVDGVVGYYSPHHSTVGEEMARRLSRSWREGRSGDLMLLYEPYRFERYGDGRGIAFGSPYRYDSDTSLILFGKRFRTGIYEREIEASSIAPTLAALLGIAAPSSTTGRILDEALLPTTDPSVGPPAPPID